MNAEREELAQRIRIANRLIRQTESDIERCEQSSMKSPEGAKLREMMLETLRIDHAALISGRERLIRQELQAAGVIRQDGQTT